MELGSGISGAESVERAVVCRENQRIVAIFVPLGRIPDNC